MGTYLKPIFGLILLTGPLFAGFQQYDVWIILPLIGIFTLAKLTEKPGFFTGMIQSLLGRDDENGPKQALLVLGGTLLAQAIVVSIFFALSFGASAMFYGITANTYPWFIPLILSGLGVLAAVLISKTALTDDLADEMMMDDSGGESAQSLMERWVAMADADFMMPVEIFALARDMVDHPDRELIGTLLNDGYDETANAFQRRVYFTYIRFADGGDLGIENVKHRILQGLGDESGWVAYDAVWAYGTLNFTDDAVDQRLRDIADKHPKPDDVSSSDPQANLYKKVHEVLEQLGVSKPD